MAFPAWASELARTYSGGAVNTFLLHGNLHDIAPVTEEQGLRFVSLRDFLTREMFPKRESIIYYDQSAGITFPTEGRAVQSGDGKILVSMREDFMRVAKAVDSVQGTGFSERLPREPARALPLIERFLRTKLLDRPDYRAAIILDYAHFIAPASMGSSFSQDDAACLITLSKWSSDPQFTKADITIVLLCENLSDLHPQLVRSPFTAKIQVPLPDRDERLQYLKHLCGEAPAFSAMTLDEISIHTAGLSRVNLEHMVAHARPGRRRRQSPPPRLGDALRSEESDHRERMLRPAGVRETQARP